MSSYKLVASIIDVFVVVVVVVYVTIVVDDNRDGLVYRTVNPLGG